MAGSRSDADDIEPASEDLDVQGFLDIRWRGAMANTREGMGLLRDVWPELSAHLPETADRHIKRALDELESAYQSLHAAGRHVIGQQAYDEYLEAQTKRTTGG